MAVEQVDQFKQAWMSHAYLYTKEYTSIYAGQLVVFLKQLPPPLGVGLEGSYYDCQVLAKKVGSVVPALTDDDTTHAMIRDVFRSCPQTEVRVDRGAQNQWKISASCSAVGSSRPISVIRRWVTVMHREAESRVLLRTAGNTVAGE